MRLLLLFLSIFWVSNLHSQKLDSILYTVSTLPVNSKIDTLNKLAQEQLYKDKDLCLALGLHTIQIAQEKKNTIGEANAWGILGSVDYRNGKYKNAIQKFNKAGSLFLIEKDSSNFVKNKANEALIHYFLGQYEKGEILNKECIIFDSLQNNWEGVAYSYNNLGLIYKATGNYTLASQSFQRALTLDKSRKDKKGIAGALTNLGNLYRRIEELDSAQFYHKLAFQEFIDLKDSLGIAKSLNNQGIIQEIRGNNGLAMQFFTESLRIKEKLGGKIGLGNGYINIASLFSKHNSHEDALQYLRKAYTIFENTDFLEKKVLILLNIGVSYCRQSKCGKALSYFKEALNLLKNQKSEQKESLYLNICQSYYESNIPDSAMIHCITALSLANKSNPNKRNLAQAHRFLGQLFNDKNDLEKAHRHLEKAKSIANEINHPDELREVSKALANLYAKQNNYRAAYENEQLSNWLADSLKSVELAIAMKRVEAKFNNEKQARELAEKQQEIAEKAKEVAERNSMIALLAFSLLSLSVIFIFIRKRYKKTKKELVSENLKVKSEKAEIELERNEAQQQVNRVTQSSEFFNNRTIHFGGKKILLKKIIYIDSIGSGTKKLRIFTQKNEAIIGNGNLDSFHLELLQHIFVRSHRSYIVNLHHVETISNQTFFFKEYVNIKDKKVRNIGGTRKDYVTETFNKLNSPNNN